MRFLFFLCLFALVGCASKPPTRVVRNIYYENSKLMVEVCGLQVTGFPGYAVSMTNCQTSAVTE